MKRIPLLIVTLLALLSISTTVAGASSRAASSFPSIPGGYAYSGYVITPGAGPNGTNALVNFPIGAISVSCSPPPVSANKAVNNILLNPYMTTATGQNDITTVSNATGSTSQARSIVNNVNLLGGMITADAVRAIASSTATGAGVTSTDNGSAFVGLKVGGVPIATPPSPNTTLPLPGYGYVVLHEESGPINGQNASSIGITMLDVYITTSNPNGLAAGTQIAVAHASSSNTRTAEPTVVGAESYRAYSTGFTNSGSSTTGTVAPAGIACSGGDAQTGANGSSSTILSTQSANDTASGQITPYGSKATSSATMSGLNMLNGLIQATKVSSLANAAWNGTGSGSASTSLVNGEVAGVLLSSAPKPNTYMQLPGIGEMILNQQYSQVTPAGALEEVNAIVIYVTKSNSLGLPVGSQIVLAHSDASAKSY